MTQASKCFLQEVLFDSIPLFGRFRSLLIRRTTFEVGNPIDQASSQYFYQLDFSQGPQGCPFFIDVSIFTVMHTKWWQKWCQWMYLNLTQKKVRNAEYFHHISLFMSWTDDFEMNTLKSHLFWCTSSSSKKAIVSTTNVRKRKRGMFPRKSGCGGEKNHVPFLLLSQH